MGPTCQCGKPLSPSATPFRPTSCGRSKSMRWDEICSDDEADDLGPQRRLADADRRASLHDSPGSPPARWGDPRRRRALLRRALRGAPTSPPPVEPPTRSR